MSIEVEAKSKIFSVTFWTSAKREIVSQLEDFALANQKSEGVSLSSGTGA